MQKISKTQILNALKSCGYDPKDEFMQTFLTRHDVSYLESRASDLLMEALQVVRQCEGHFQDENQLNEYNARLKLAIQFAITAMVRRNGPIQSKEK